MSHMTQSMYLIKLNNTMIWCNPCVCVCVWWCVWVGVGVGVCGCGWVGGWVWVWVGQKLKNCFVWKLLAAGSRFSSLSRNMIWFSCVPTSMQKPSRLLSFSAVATFLKQESSALPLPSQKLLHLTRAKVASLPRNTQHRTSLFQKAKRIIGAFYLSSLIYIYIKKI